MERFFAWGGIAYTFGFLIVLLHTSRLGLPVIELLNPVLIWIGVPLALVTFFSSRLFKLLRGRMDAARAELALLIEEAPVQSPVFHSELPKAFPTERVAKEASEAMPSLIFRPASAWVIRRWLQFFLSRVPSTPERGEALARAGERSIRMLRTAAAIRYFLNAVIFTGMILFVVGVYVWTIYPRIPQSAGGGKPAWVRLALKSDAIPQEIQSDLLTAPANGLGTEGSFMTDPIQLLYTAKDAIYIRTNTGRAMSISKGGVLGTVWR
jgi:hypothetical protein